MLAFGWIAEQVIEHDVRKVDEALAEAISFQSSTDLTNFLSQVDADAPLRGLAHALPRPATLFAATATRVGREERHSRPQNPPLPPAPLPG